MKKKKKKKQKGRERERERKCAVLFIIINGLAADHQPLFSSSSRSSLLLLFHQNEDLLPPPSPSFPPPPQKKRSPWPGAIERDPSSRRRGRRRERSSGHQFGPVGDFMTKREELHTVKPTTTVDEALQKLVENRITGFPVIDDDWKLVGVVSDYDLLALDSISGTGRTDTSLFPEADSTWKTFNEIQRLLSKTNGKVVGELMTPAPLVVRETTNLGDAARLLLETKYRRLPVVDSAGKLVGIITRGNVVRAALEIKRAFEKSSKA